MDEKALVKRKSDSDVSGEQVMPLVERCLLAVREDMSDNATY